MDEDMSFTLGSQEYNQYLSSDVAIEVPEPITSRFKNRIVQVANQGLPIEHISGWDFDYTEPNKENGLLLAEAELTVYFFRETGRPFVDVYGEEAEKFFEWLEANVEKFF